jgi:hypothetical protein
MSKKSTRKTTSTPRTLAEREAYHKRALENIATRKQIADLRKKLKS